MAGLLGSQVVAALNDAPRHIRTDVSVTRMSFEYHDPVPKDSILRSRLGKRMINTNNGRGRKETTVI